MPSSETKARIQDLLNRIQDVYFDYDKHELRPDAEMALEGDAKTLREILSYYPTYKLTVEGFCDERGSDEYNLALGDSRAKKARDFLETLGMPATQLNVVSYGKEKPVCREHDETCWQKNRRAHITQEQLPNRRES
jgi:peptidoglycan-associated lipoprotein